MYRRLNFLGALTCFVVTIFGVANGWPMVGPLAIAIWLAASSFCMADLARQLGLIAVVGLLGSLLESVAISRGVYLPTGDSTLDAGPSSWLCPLWITSLWVGLGLSLHGHLAWLQRHWSLAARIGAVSAPALYGAAHYGGAITILIPPLYALGLFAVAGAIVLPLALLLAQSRAYQTREVVGESATRA